MTIYLYRIYCQTENVYVNKWSETLPTTCPNNNTHTISQNTIAIVDKISPNSISIKQESVPTGGNFKIKGFVYSCPANQTTTFNVSWPINITVSTVRIYSIASQIGDVLNASVNPETVVGILTAECSIGQTIASVNSTVISNSKIGYICYINSEKLGMITNVDPVNNTITFENATTATHAAGSFFKIEVLMIENYPLGMEGESCLGESNIGGTHLPANSVTRIEYTNNSDTTKIHKFSVEYLY